MQLLICNTSMTSMGSIIAKEFLDPLPPIKNVHYFLLSNSVFFVVRLGYVSALRRRLRVTRPARSTMNIFFVKQIFMYIFYRGGGAGLYRNSLLGKYQSMQFGNLLYMPNYVPWDWSWERWRIVYCFNRTTHAEFRIKFSTYTKII